MQSNQQPKEQKAIFWCGGSGFHHGISMRFSTQTRHTNCISATRGLRGTPAPRSRFAPALQRCVAKYKQITITSECWSKAGPPGGIKPLSHLVHPGEVQVLALKKSISLKACHHRCGSQDTWMARYSLQESSLQESSVLQEQLEHTNHQGEINN